MTAEKKALIDQRYQTRAFQNGTISELIFQLRWRQVVKIFLYTVGFILTTKNEEFRNNEILQRHKEHRCTL